MKSLIFVAILAGLVVGYNCSTRQEELVESCLEESENWKKYVEYVGERDIKDRYFQDFYYARATRLVCAGRVANPDCPKEVGGQQLEILSNKDLDVYLCTQGKSLEAWVENCKDEGTCQRFWKYIALFKEQRGRLSYSSLKCPEEAKVDLEIAERFALKLKEFFHQTCKVEALGDFIRSSFFTAYKAVGYKVKDKFIQNPERRFVQAHEIRVEFCSGSLAKCCGKQLVENAVREGHPEAAKIFVDSINELTSKVKDRKKLLETFKKIFEETGTNGEPTQKALSLFADKMATLT